MLLQGGIFHFAILCALLLHTETKITIKRVNFGATDLYMNSTENGTHIELFRDNISKLKGTIGVGFNFTDPENSNFSIIIYDSGEGFAIDWVSNDVNLVIKDCYDLQKGKLNWYGGPEIYTQQWPIEKLKLSGNIPYVVRKDENFAVPERYWLSSNGAFIYVSERSPLFVDQNVEEDGKVCFIAKNQGPYINRKTLVHHYNIMALEDPVSAHRVAAATFFGHPTSTPNKRLIEKPIWTTWAKYKKYINDTIVRNFAYDVLHHGFSGQIEIDEQWELCFGSRVFAPGKFGNISSVVKDLKQKNFTVSLWAAPFVNTDCVDVVTEGEARGYFVENTNGNMSTVWWESNNARQIDFTNPEARQWYSNKLRNILENPGVDSFKFDAGETDYVAQPAEYKTEDPYLVPNIFTQRYINTVAQFGDLIEARSAFKTQNNTFFLRMIDKESDWGVDNGLQSVVTTLLQMNMVGYSFVLPDMIGGNGYKFQPTLELLIRWTQAVVFMPSMQFSYLPWDFPDDKELNGTDIITSFIKLHEKYAPTIIKAMEKTISDSTPTNAPIWWIAPKDEIALRTSDEYLLGENILVAPVMEQGARSRNVYLPRGNWQDGNDEKKIYHGPVNITYDAPLSVLPYFLRQSS